MKKKLTLHDALSLFYNSPAGNVLTTHMAGLIDGSPNLYRDYLTVERLDKVYIFPWSDWQLFKILKEKSLLSTSSKLHSMPLDDVVKFYNQYFEEMKTDTQAVRIEKLRSSMLSKGYMNIVPNLILFESNAKDILYSCDGHHRLIPYQDLLSKKSIEPVQIDCVFVEVESIEQKFGKVRHLIL